MHMMNLDRIDHAILRCLSNHGRLSIAELAKKVGLSASACSRRLSILEQGGAIRGYRADINPTALGLTVIAYVHITLDRQAIEELSRFEHAVRSISAVLDCHLMAGEADYILRVAARDIADYERIHRDQLSKLPGINSMTSSFALREVVTRQTPLITY